MSETITVTVKSRGEKFIFAYHRQENFLTVLLKNMGLAGSFCMGQSGCGRCKVCFTKGAPAPVLSDRRMFTARELRMGWRLACYAKPVTDCQVEIGFAQEQKPEVVTAVCSEGVSKDSGKSVGSIRKEQPSCLPQEWSDKEKGPYRIAVDMGTTTIAMQLRSLQTGRILDTYGTANPQNCYGADVLSRIQAANQGHKEELRQMLIQTLEQGIAGFRYDAGQISGEQHGQTDDRQSENGTVIQDMVIAANTTMAHLLMGYETAGLGVSPFQPFSLETAYFQTAGIPTVLYPGISAFVGGDITAGIVACGMHTESEITLLIDLGTNGEMVLGNREKLLATAAAAGPAFEGSLEFPIWGADMIHATAFLLEQGSLDETGLLQEPYFETGVEAEGVKITQGHIRILQMAKAAIRCGIEILVQKYGLRDVKDIVRVYLAGGFGYYTDVDSAVRIGLLPPELRDRTITVGNTALEGAFRYSEEADRIPALTETFQLAEQENFAESYLNFMNFG